MLAKTLLIALLGSVLNASPVFAEAPTPKAPYDGGVKIFGAHASAYDYANSVNFTRIGEVLGRHASAMTGVDMLDLFPFGLNRTKAIVNLQSQLFDEVKRAYRTNTLKPDGSINPASDLGVWVPVLKEHLSKIQAFYIYDEPEAYGMPVSQLTLAIQVVHQIFPGIPTIITYSHHCYDNGAYGGAAPNNFTDPACSMGRLDASQRGIPSNLDIVAFDWYSWDWVADQGKPCTVIYPGFRSELLPIPRVTASPFDEFDCRITLAVKRLSGPNGLAGGRPILLTVEGIPNYIMTARNPAHVSTLGEADRKLRSYLLRMENLADHNPQVIGFLAFRWDELTSSVLPERFATALRGLPLMNKEFGDGASMRFPGLTSTVPLGKSDPGPSRKLCGTEARSYWVPNVSDHTQTDKLALQSTRTLPVYPYFYVGHYHVYPPTPQPADWLMNMAILPWRALLPSGGNPPAGAKPGTSTATTSYAPPLAPFRVMPFKGNSADDADKIPLTRCAHRSNGAQFYSTDPCCEGHTYLDQYGYVYANNNPGDRQPVYRFFSRVAARSSRYYRTTPENFADFINETGGTPYFWTPK